MWYSCRKFKKYEKVKTLLWCREKYNCNYNLIGKGLGLIRRSTGPLRCYTCLILYNFYIYINILIGSVFRTRPKQFPTLIGKLKNSHNTIFGKKEKIKYNNVRKNFNKECHGPHLGPATIQIVGNIFIRWIS